MFSIDGINVNATTIDDQEVREITVDGEVVWVAGPVEFFDDFTSFDNSRWNLAHRASYDSVNENVKTNDGSNRTEGQLYHDIREIPSRVVIEGDVNLAEHGTTRINILNADWDGSGRNDSSGSIGTYVEFYDYGTELRGWVDTDADGNKDEPFDKYNYSSSGGSYHFKIDISQGGPFKFWLDGNLIWDYSWNVQSSGSYVSFESDDYEPLGKTTWDNISITFP